MNPYRMNLSRFFLEKICRWHICGEFPDVAKSIAIFAPHTSYWDAVLGKLFFWAEGVPHRLLAKHAFFWFPLNLVLRAFGAVPIQKTSRNGIFTVVDTLSRHDRMNMVISPEGAFALRPRWNDGFIYMAQKAEVPIVVGYIDYRRRELGVKGVITDTSDKKAIYDALRVMYSGVTARYPETFALPINELQRDE